MQNDNPFNIEQCRAAHAKTTNDELLQFFDPLLPRWSARLKTFLEESDDAGLASLGRACRAYANKLSEWNIAAGSHANETLLAVEDYLDSTARNIELALARQSKVDDSGEEWKKDI